MSEAEGIVKSALSVGTRWLQEVLGIDETTVDQIRKALPKGQRVVVIFDDLDRADPHLVPELLLRLRDLLELKGFSFLIPFDLAVLVQGLERQYTALVRGNVFLKRFLISKSTCRHHRWGSAWC